MKRNILLSKIVITLCFIILISYVGVFAAEQAGGDIPEAVQPEEITVEADNAETNGNSGDFEKISAEDNESKSLYTSDNLPMMIAVIVIFSAGGVYTFMKMNKNADKSIK